MKKDKILELAMGYQKIEDELFYLREKTIYWMPEKGLTDEGLRKRKELKRKQAEILKKLDIPQGVPNESRRVAFLKNEMKKR